MKTRHGKAPGFTMIEVLVVIGILVFLASLSFWGLSNIRGNMRIRQTRTLVQRVASAIKDFHTAYNEWPTEDMLTTINPPQTWYEFLSGGYTKIKMAAGSMLSKYEYRGPYLELGANELNGAGEIIDPWKNPLIIDVDATAGTVLVYSFGPDEESDEGHEEGDGCPDANHTTDPPIDDIKAR